MGNSKVIKVAFVKSAIFQQCELEQTEQEAQLPLLSDRSRLLMVLIVLLLVLLKIEQLKSIQMRIVIRTFLVLCTVFIASVVPYFGDFLSLISALSVVATAFVFPPIFFYVLHMRQFILHVQDGYYGANDQEEGHESAHDGRSVQSPSRVNPLYAGDVTKPLSPPWLMYLCILVEVGVVGSVVGCYFAGKALQADIQAGGNPFDDYFISPGY